MFEYHKIEPTSSRRTALQNFDIKTQTWLVADLEQKRFIQNCLLEKNGYLPEDACLRASELWTKIISLNDPDYTVVSKSLIDIILQEWLPQQNLDWASGPSAVPTLLEYVNFFLPLFCGTDAESAVQLMRQWLKDNRDSMIRWGGWFELSWLAWQELRHRKMALATWTPALALSFADGITWPRSLVLDLGAEITSVEAELFTLFAKDRPIQVFVPADHWRFKYPKALWPYELLGAEKSETNVADKVKSPGLHCSKYITKLSEVKTCVSRVRRWLDAGAKPHEISIYAVDPEDYWPSLRAYLNEEGVPVAKDVVTVLQSIPSVGQWIANMRVQVRTLNSEDFEMALYGSRMKLSLRYDEFRVLLSEIYEEQDLARLQEVKALLDRGIRPGQILSRDEFIAFAVHCWDLHEDPETFKDVISTILLESTAHVGFAVEGWISYVQAIAAKAERRLIEGQADGVMIRKLTSAVVHESPYVFCLGLDEASMAPRENVNITFSEVLRIGQDIGFHLPRPDASATAFLADWLASSSYKECDLAYPMTDFRGEPSAPSLFWFDQARDDVDITVQLSRWDEIQRLDVEAIRKFRPSVDEKFGEHLRRDRGEEPQQVTMLSWAPKWSASQLENYKKCPFKFTANRLFRLRDEPEVDLDMDRMRRGRLLHKALELVMQQGLSRSWTDKDLLDLIEVARFAEGLYVYSSIWPQYKLTFLRTLKSFLNFETEWRQQFSATTTVATELEFKGEWLGHPISGKIDRVDSDDNGHYVIIDYKTSGYDLRNYESWLSNHQLQLMVYMKAIESGWTSLPAGRVVGACYFNLKSMNRDKGFLLEDESLRLYPLHGRLKNIIAADALEKLKSDFEMMASEMAEQMRQGRYFAAPEDQQKYCKGCEWRSVCRAPHLNL